MQSFAGQRASTTRATTSHYNNFSRHIHPPRPVSVRIKCYMCLRFPCIKITRFYIFARRGSVRRRFPSAEYLTPLTPLTSLPSSLPFYVALLLFLLLPKRPREFSVFISLLFPFYPPLALTFLIELSPSLSRLRSPCHPRALHHLSRG